MTRATDSRPAPPADPAPASAGPGVPAADAAGPDTPGPEVRALALVQALRPPADIPRPQRVYANRSLRLGDIELVGFDMDYTLALYDQPRVEELSIRATLDKLISDRGYPSEIRGLDYDPTLGIRGLVVDLQYGHVFKPDRYGAPGRVRHGRRLLERAQVDELYGRERTSLSQPRFAWIDTLFALPEAVMYVALVDFFDGVTGNKPDYARLWRDIRECIDAAHRDDSIKGVIAADLPRYVRRDPGLAETLHRLRSAGKRLFLLTNSEWPYTDKVMRYLLDGVLPAYVGWRQYFDIAIVSAMKPGFFTGQAPFAEIDPDTGATRAASAAIGNGAATGNGAGTPPFVRGRVYGGGNLKDFEERARIRGGEVLFVGDHIYGDMLRPRKTSTWRTAMVLQELEHEVATHDRIAADLEHLERLERHLRHLDAEIVDKQNVLRLLQKLEDGGDTEGLAAAKREAKELLDRLRADLRATMAEHTRLETDLDAAFNPVWGPLFREGREVSKFGEQVEEYAFLYTSRVSNLRFYPPNRHFRGPRDRMPHER